MKLSNTTRILREDLPDAPPGEWLDLLLKRINDNNEQTTQCLRNNVTLADNQNVAVITKRFTDGVELSIANPLKTRPIGMHAIRSTAIAGGTRQTVESVDWRFIDPPDPTAKQQLGVTVRYVATSSASSTVTESVVGIGSRVTMNNNAATTITTISVAAGSHDVCGLIQFDGNPSSVTKSGVCVNSSSAFATQGDNAVLLTDQPTWVTLGTHTVPPKRFTVSSTTTLYLVGFIAWASGSAYGFGRITAVSATAGAVVSTAQNDVTLVIYGG